MRRTVVLTLIAGIAWAQAPPDRRNFLACPIVRDTKTTPCWLAEYKGEIYFLGIQGGVVEDFYPPQLGHQILVEGAVAEGPRVCGGIPLRPVKLSVLQEVAAACSTMLPAEDGIEAPPRVRSTGPAPSWVQLDGPHTSTLYFDFDNDFLSFHTTGAIINAVNDFKNSKASQIEVTGSQGATLLSSGEIISEKSGLGQVRARKVADMLIGLGVRAESVIVATPANSVTADGVNDPWNRRVVIRVLP